MGHSTAQVTKSRKAFFVFLLAFVLFFSSPGLTVQAATDGPRAPTAYSNNNSVSNPDRAYIDDSNYATFNGSGDRVDYQTFGFSSIPTGSTINGIIVTARGYRDTMGGGDPRSFPWHSLPIVELLLHPQQHSVI